MRQALLEAKKAAQLGENPGRGGHRAGQPGDCPRPQPRELDQDALAHAEVLCIRQACQTLHSWRLSGCQLYVTLEPCPMCSGAIINARLDRVVYGARDPKAGCAGSVADLFVMPFNHTPVIRSGILEEECAQLLSDFFAGLRSFSPRSPRNLTVIHTPWMLKTLLKLFKTMIFYPYFTLGNRFFHPFNCPPVENGGQLFPTKFAGKILSKESCLFSSCRKYAGIV